MDLVWCFYAIIKDLYTFYEQNYLWEPQYIVVWQTMFFVLKMFFFILLRFDLRRSCMQASKYFTLNMI